MPGNGVHRIFDLRAAKEVAFRELPPGQAGREALLCAPDDISEEQFDLLVPTWIRLLRLKSREGA
jgi:hypothetical protein